MILKSITPIHFGPFAAETTLHLDPEVTVLTGPNDAGKTLALRAIEVLCTQEVIRIHEVNRDRVREFSGKWSEDPEIVCNGVFEITDTSTAKSKRSSWERVGALITVNRKMTKTQGQIIEISDGKSKVNPQTTFARSPSVLKLPLATEIRQEINLSEMNAAERQLIKLGFGSEFSLEQHRNLDQIDRSFRINEAQTQLNDMLRMILPKAMPLSFKLLEVGAKPELLGIGLVDKHQGYAPLGSRGAGVRKLLNVMGAILRVNPAAGNLVILYDEPETSLHSDAQHMLRRLLESLASHPNVQVVYTTHSPAMVNTLRPQSVRVLERKRVNGKAVSVFLNSATVENYALVRTSLGVTPADSLLYAPITIVAEGPTEVQCIPLVLKKLTESKVLGHQLLETLLSQTHILDGEGSSFEYMCRLAKSQNAKPVVFLDGDKDPDVKKLKEKHPDVPVITLSTGTEFEEVVPRARYIEAAAKVLDGDSGKICEANFVAWEKAAGLRPSVMFSKRVERWLRDEFDKPLYKPLVMRKAIELCDIDEIHREPFVKLADAMKEVGNSLT